MPKGVEHIGEFDEFGDLISVSSSQMPKGVEHIKLVPYVHIHRGVSSSQMPKGVEHATLSLVITDKNGVFITDAERR